MTPVLGLLKVVSRARNSCMTSLEIVLGSEVALLTVNESWPAVPILFSDGLLCCSSKLRAYYTPNLKLKALCILKQTVQGTQNDIRKY